MLLGAYTHTAAHSRASHSTAQHTAGSCFSRAQHVCTAVRSVLRFHRSSALADDVCRRHRSASGRAHALCAELGVRLVNAPERGKLLRCQRRRGPPGPLCRPLRWPSSYSLCRRGERSSLAPRRRCVRAAAFVSEARSRVRAQPAHGCTARVCQQSQGLCACAACGTTPHARTRRTAPGRVGLLAPPPPARVAGVARAD
jgi:hypothetical protein